MEEKKLEELISEAEELSRRVLNREAEWSAQQLIIEKIKLSRKRKNTAKRVISKIGKAAAAALVCFGIWAHTPSYNNLMASMSSEYATCSKLLSEAIRDSNLQNKAEYLKELNEKLDGSQFPGKSSINIMLWLYENIIIKNFYDTTELFNSKYTQDEKNKKKKEETPITISTTQLAQTTAQESQSLSNNKSPAAVYQQSAAQQTKTQENAPQLKNDNESTTAQERKRFEEKLSLYFDAIFREDSPSLKQYLPEMYKKQFAKSDWTGLYGILRAVNILTYEQKKALDTLVDGNIENGEVGNKAYFYMVKDRSAIYTDITTPYGKYYVKLLIKNTSGNWEEYNQKCDLAKKIIFGS
ncbi:MAG: hypothetical protein QXW00_01140 [Candidatus Woesearchaeota archaeon]